MARLTRRASTKIKPQSPLLKPDSAAESELTELKLEPLQTRLRPLLLGRFEFSLTSKQNGDPTKIYESSSIHVCARICTVFRAGQRLITLIVRHQQNILGLLTEEEKWQWNANFDSKGEWAESLSLRDGVEGWEGADERLEGMDLTYVRARELTRVGTSFK